MQLSDKKYELWFSVAMLLYATPFVHNVRCIEVPFNAGYDLALRYLAVPAVAFVVLGCRRMREIRRHQGYRLPAQVFFSAVLFGWIIGLGQAYVVIGNAVLPPQQAVTYRGVIVDKFKSGRFGETHVVRLSTSLPQSAIIALLVSPLEYAHLELGDGFSKRMVLGSLGISYIDHCGWLQRSFPPNNAVEQTGGSRSLAAVAHRQR